MKIKARILVFVLNTVFAAIGYAATPDLSPKGIESIASEAYESAWAYRDNANLGMQAERASAIQAVLIEQPDAMRSASTEALNRLFAALCTRLKTEQRQALSLSFDGTLPGEQAQADPGRVELAAWLRAVSGRSDEQVPNVWRTPELAEAISGQLSMNEQDLASAPRHLGLTPEQANLIVFDMKWRHLGAWLDSDRPYVRRYAVAAVLAVGFESLPEPADLLVELLQEPRGAALWHAEVYSWAFRHQDRLDAWLVGLASLLEAASPTEKVFRNLSLAYLNEIEPESVVLGAGNYLRLKAIDTAQSNEDRMLAASSLVHTLLIRAEFDQAESIVRGLASSEPSLHSSTDALLAQIEDVRSMYDYQRQIEELRSHITRREADKQWLLMKLNQLDAIQSKEPVREKITSGLKQIDGELAGLSNQLETLLKVVQ